MINLDRVHGVTPSMTAEKAMAAVKAWPPTRRSATAPPSPARRRKQAVRRGRKEAEERDIGLGGASAGDYADGPPGASVLALPIGGGCAGGIWTLFAVRGTGTGLARHQCAGLRRAPATTWGLATTPDSLIKAGPLRSGWSVRHGRYVTVQLAEVAVPRELFRLIRRPSRTWCLGSWLGVPGRFV